MLKQKFLFCIFFIATISCNPEREKRFTLDNSDGPMRFDEPFTMERKSLIRLIGDIPEDYLPLFISNTDDTLISQFDDMNLDGEWDEVALLCNLNENSHTTVTVHFIRAEEYPVFITRTNIRFGISEDKDNQFHDVNTCKLDPEHIPQEEPRPYQFEGPGWENDVVAFRLYFDSRNGKDIFGKTKSKMILDQVIDGYHELQDWGMDILKVGTSLGAGSLAIVANDSIVRLGNIEDVTFKQIAEGPVRSVFDLIYKDWDVNGKLFDLTERITIWAGKYWYQSELFLDRGEGLQELIAGIVNMQSEELFNYSNDDFTAIFTFDNQSYIEDNLGMAIVVNNTDFGGSGEAGPGGVTETYFMKMKTSTDNPSLFYFFAGWEMSDARFKTFEGFRKYLMDEIDKLSGKVRYY